MITDKLTMMENELFRVAAERDRYKAKVDDLILSNIVISFSWSVSERDALIEVVKMAIDNIDDKQYPAVHGALVAALNKIKEG